MGPHWGRPLLCCEGPPSWAGRDGGDLKVFKGEASERESGPPVRAAIGGSNSSSKLLLPSAS